MSTLPTPVNLGPEHMLTLYQITGILNSSLEFDEVLTNSMDAIMQVTKAQRGFLMVANDEASKLEVHVSRGIDGQTIAEEGYSTTIVNQVAETRQPILTNNAQHDNRFTPGQSIIMRGLRAILCAPMLVQDRLVGVVYVDTAMRSGTFNEQDRDLLNAIAGLAARAIENARLYRVAVIKGRLERELQMASEIQRGLLPRVPPIKGFEVAPRWQAAREVAGDFYDIFKLDDDTFSVVIADVSDKGASAALFMAVARTYIRSHVASGLGPTDTIYRTNELILVDAESGMFVTVYHSLFNYDGASVHVNAGHNPPLYYRHATREITFMPKGGRAIGWFPDIPVREVRLELEPGDVIVYYTDGLTDAENPRGEFYGESRLVRALTEVAGRRSASEILDHIIKSVDEFCEGAPPFDDLTMVIVRYTGK